MKKVTALILAVILVMVMLTGCIVIPRYRNFEIDPDVVASIELYDLCEVDTMYGDFVKTESPAYRIPPERTADFLRDLSQIQFSDPLIIVIAAIDPSFYYDNWTVRVNYTDGSFELISSDGFGQVFDKDEETKDSHHFGCDQEEWSALIRAHIPKELWEHTHNAG